MKVAPFTSLNFITNKNTLIVAVIIFFGFVFLNMNIKSDYERFSDLVDAKYTLKLFMDFDSIEDLSTTSGVVWHIFKNDDSMLQVAEFEGRIVGVFIKTDSLRTKLILDSALLYKESATVLYDDRIEISYLDKETQDISSLLTLSKKSENYIDILFEDEQVYSIQMIYLINYEREIRGLSPLTENCDLHIVAKDYSKTLLSTEYFSHTSVDNVSPLERVEGFGFDFKHIGENLVKGEEMNPFHAHNKLMNSPGHKKNILNSKYSLLSIGTSKESSQVYVCELFGSL